MESATITVLILRMLVLNVRVAFKVTSGLLVEPILATVGLSYATTMHGAQCVMTSGEHLMLMWSVDNLDLLEQVLYLFAMPSLARELVASSWMMSSVLALKPDSLTAVQMCLAEPIVSTVRMLVSDADLCVPMVTSDLLVELQHLRVELKFVTIMPGALCVMTSGEFLMPTWPVDNLGTLASMHRPYPVLPLVRVLGPSSWTMSSALVMRAGLWTVPIMELAHITVSTLKMPVSAAVLQGSVMMDK